MRTCEQASAPDARAHGAELRATTNSHCARTSAQPTLLQASRLATPHTYAWDATKRQVVTVSVPWGMVWVSLQVQEPCLTVYV